MPYVGGFDKLLDKIISNPEEIDDEELRDFIVKEALEMREFLKTQPPLLER